MKYILMHREIPVAELELDELSHVTAIGQVFHLEHFPVGTVNKIGVERKSLSKWWESRSIPASRSGVREALRKLDMSVPQELLDKCYGLSLSDQYWISPVDAPLTWSDINFFDNPFSEDMGDLLFGRADGSDDMSLVAPDNTSDGQLLKKWKIVDGKRVLIKGSGKPYHQEALCEVIASEIARRLNIPHVPYTLMEEDGELFSVCEDFVTRDTELVGASHIIKAFKKPNGVSEYEFYLQCLDALGISHAREAVEQMLVLDFIIANEDRHYNNLGAIRDAVTLEWLGIAPIFDCGTSLWYNTQSSMIRPASEDIPAKPFKKTHGQQIELLTDLSWVDFGALNGIEDYASDILSRSPYISEQRRDILCASLRQRIDLLQGIAEEQAHRYTQDSIQ